MSTTQPNQSLNQFRPGAVRGQQDQQFIRSGVISGLISPDLVADTILAGFPVKLDPNTPRGGLPQFLAAAKTELALGYIVYSAQKSTLVKGDACQVAGLMGPVMYGVAGAAFNPGTQLQDDDDGNQITLGVGKFRAVALDGASAAGQVFRMIIMGQAGKAA